MLNEPLLELLKKLSLEFNSILEKTDQSNGRRDGIMLSILATLDKSIQRVSNNLPLGNDLRIGIDNANAVATKTFEGSGIDEDLFKLSLLAEQYQNNW